MTVYCNDRKKKIPIQFDVGSIINFHRPKIEKRNKERKI